MSEVKETVNEIVFPLLEAMKSREDEAIRATNCINTMFKEIKEMQTIARSSLMMKGNVQKVNKHIEKVDKEVGLSKEMVSLMTDNIDARIYKVEN